MLDVKKSSAMPPDIVRQNLDQMIERLSVKSKRTWEHRGRKETSDEVQHVWNRLKTREGGISYVINEQHPLVKKLIDQAPSIKNDLNKLLEEIASSLPFNQLMIDLNGKAELNTK